MTLLNAFSVKIIIIDELRIQPDIISNRKSKN